ncbi:MULTISPECIES: DUF1565 domain-containing protein [Nostoc]|uniref:DUF1565 domain-containing protein n=1 Tax=Nostoc paludosum FACHB-159 TaxID=2692908 RepID=A0ABR8K1E8_9NOSO|nr:MULTISPECIES: DUF1565 domain-containing protein [Nostoc]MBD2676448.1 DUF1565 domain-containing protein [Nostoc sp. FACHB-857]MBD2732420.1 DUF1565 domain-containing protein [Nostoc paludosum FACHB-159]
MIPYFLFSTYRSINTLQGKRKFLEATKLLVLSSYVVIFTLTFKLTRVDSALAELAEGIAQMPSTPDSAPIGEKNNSQANVLFVNPNAGDDGTGNGSQSAPVKTITQALRLASSNTVIMLSPGTYSTETGEVFPLMLKPGVSIQGNPGDRGKDILIQGGGDYLSRSFGGQNVTIVGANQAVLTGVTLTNSNRRGYGLWIESSNPVVVENTFAGNMQDGISVSGNAAPTISKNYFDGNGANGITIAGNSRPQVQENIFHETGFGINIAQNAAPVVIGNQIQNNRSGIIVQANARPILRNNIIQGSKEDGLVAIAQAMPDLGNASEPGGNEFQNNGRYDINASAAKQVISAAGNNLGSDRIAGNVDLNGTTALATENSQPAPVPNNVAPEIPASREITFSAPGVPETTNTPTSNSISTDNLVPAQLNSQLLPLQPASVPLSPPISNQQPPTSQVAGFPTPSNLPARQISTSAQVATSTPAQPPKTPQFNYVQIDPNTIEFSAPQYSSSVAQPAVPSTANQTQQSLPKLEPTALGNEAMLPVANTPNLPKVPTSSTTMSYRGNSGTQYGIRYRVVVTLVTDKDGDLVRSLAPGAFPTVWQGQKVMQAGVFDSEYNAKEMLKTLSSKGLRVIMEPLN